MVPEQKVNELGLYEIYQQWHVPFWHTTAFYILSGAMVLAVLGLVGWHMLKKYRLKKKPALSWEIALTQIDHLKKNNYTSVEHGKEFYCALTGILKRYMHERYGFEAREKTDQEFLRYLEEQKFSTLFMHDLTALFEGSTIIKFANASAAQQQIDKDVAAAISFIKKTIAPKAE